jgi:hypothetical protein
MLDGINAEAVHAVLLKKLRRSLHVAVHRRVFLIDIGEVEERVVLNLITVVPAPAGDVRVMMKIAVGVAGVIAE